MVHGLGGSESAATTAEVMRRDASAEDKAERMVAEEYNDQLSMIPRGFGRFRLAGCVEEGAWAYTL